MRQPQVWYCQRKNQGCASPLVAFNDKVYLAAQGTNSQEFVDAISHERSYGGTAFYDAG
jgi:hypothetical protein